MSWRAVTMWARERPLALRVADRLGRSRGRLRLLDRLHRPGAAPLQPDFARWEEKELAAAWIGHATVLLRIGQMTVLTDPVFSNRIGIGFGLLTGGPGRLTAPAVQITDLPPIDLVLISHAHFDHLDRPTLVKLPKRTRVVTAHQTGDLIRDLGFRRIVELRWGEGCQIDALNVTACPANHWGARTIYDNYRGYNAYLLQSGKRRILYGGDTAYHERFKETGKVDFAVLGIGAYDPWIQSHASPEQAWRMADHVRADFLVPMHHSTFRLSQEPTGEPIERILCAAGADEHRVVVRAIGGQWSLN